MSNGYDEFQRIMAEINRKKQLEELKNNGGDFNNIFKDIFG
jgi:hypothetical protein